VALPDPRVDPRPRPLPTRLRSALFRAELRVAFRRRRPEAAVRAVLAFGLPSRWPPRAAERDEVLAAAIAAGDLEAARVAAGSRTPAAHRPWAPEAAVRAAALEALAATEEPLPARIDATIAAYLRGRFSPAPRRQTEIEPAAAAARAIAAAERRTAGRPDPVIVATFPGFDPNPYGRLMESTYSEHGLVAIHAASPDAVDAIVAAARGRHPVVVHCNAPDRFVARARGAVNIAAATDAALRRLDDWLAAGAVLVYSLHNQARLFDERAGAEQRVTQAVADRAAIVHVLTPSAVRLVEGWIHIDPARVRHVPHPSYAGAYPAAPARPAARARLGLAPSDLVVGLIGTITDRKGAVAVVEALDGVPDPLPDGRRLRLVLGGMLLGGTSERLIASALAEPRVIPRFGYLTDPEVSAVLGALDVAVVPYGPYLSSGWLHLALTFGVPVIAPATGTASEIAAPAALRVFGGSGPSLAEALRSAGELATPEARAAAASSLAGLDAPSLSSRFATLLRDLVAERRRAA